MTSNTEIIETFNKLNFKKILSLKEMALNTEYPIKAAYKATTPYGEKIVLQLNECILYLPSRFLSLADEVIKRIGDGVFAVVKLQLREGSELSKLELRQMLPTDIFYAPFYEEINKNSMQ